jgi:hypothetical protein
VPFFLGSGKIEGGYWQAVAELLCQGRQFLGVLKILWDVKVGLHGFGFWGFAEIRVAGGRTEPTWAVKYQWWTVFYRRVLLPILKKIVYL